jgi:glycosyltransferase involved in cell wall biosynthesis
MGGPRPSIVITYPYPIGQKAAGGSRTTREVARHLAMQGADVLIMPVSTNPLSRRFPRRPPDERELAHDLDAELARESVRIVRPPQNPLLYQLDGWSVRGALRRVLREQRVDAVLGHYHEAAFLPRLLQRRGVTFGFLATWQTYSGLHWQPQRFAGRLRKWFERKTVVEPHRRADVLFAISEFTRRELIELLQCDPARIVVCPLGVEPSFLEIPRAAPTAITRFLFFGRFTPSKGFTDAIEALAMLKRRGITNWTYRMFGAGRPEWAREAAAKHGIADRVQVCDPVDTATLGRELATSHLAILPSHVESFGHSMVEAQAAGIPVVAYATGSVPEVVQDGVTGWLAPFRQVDALAALIERAVKNPASTYTAGVAARERVRAKYSWANTASIILDGIRRRR